MSFIISNPYIQIQKYYKRKSYLLLWYFFRNTSKVIWLHKHPITNIITHYFFEDMTITSLLIITMPARLSAINKPSISEEKTQSVKLSKMSAFYSFMLLRINVLCNFFIKKHIWMDPKGFKSEFPSKQSPKTCLGYWSKYLMTGFRNSIKYMKVKKKLVHTWRYTTH